MEPKEHISSKASITDSEEAPSEYVVGVQGSKQGAPQEDPSPEPNWFIRLVIKFASPSRQQSPSDVKIERSPRREIDSQLEFQEPCTQARNIDLMKISQAQISDLEKQFTDHVNGKEREWMENEKSLRKEIKQLHDEKEKMKQQFKVHLKTRKREWMDKEKSLRREIKQLHENMTNREQTLQNRINDIQLDKSDLQAQHDAFVRKQQEISFRQMESARWRPVDESQVLSDLDKMKRSMRGWAKHSSIKDISMLQALKPEDYDALMQELSSVVIFEDKNLPKGISTTAKSPMLLLNALLANHIYASFFQSPFFFLERNLEDSSHKDPLFEDIYQRAKSANPQDAHTWRSQTLRLLFPPLQNDMSDGEKELHHTTEATIMRVAQQQAISFLDGPASFLMSKNAELDISAKLKRIYSEAAKLSYMLWTRRTAVKCYSLRDFERLTFDAESHGFDPDAMMRHEDHDDQLKGRPVTVLVHPLVCVVGTDEAKDYDQERVWAKGVVWLDSKI
ncbi:hypothetical protein HYFRA_00004278 [Hymenoscyphus fraxineus]|uniref:Uncharacterized protein n=1 Tax=Hymenoscyphus fraxineus TaxID=746836 RepID=A0A9N9KQX0_9HELO|nr:hypothetical protein HYFRA_00004278 [Hymenoscyphus fraxineus]